MEKSKSKSNFCIRPFNSVAVTSTGEINICCSITSQLTKFKNFTPYNMKNTDLEKWWSSDYVKYVRKSFLENKKLEECASCWKKEEAGVSSHRTRSNIEHKAIFKNKYRTNLSLLGKHDLAFPEDIELQITNLCNLKCQMCRGSDSSRLLVENNALGFEKLRQKDYDLDEVHYSKIKDMVKHDLSLISLMGGEPLFNKKIIEILSLLIKNGKSQDIKLHITTNGTICNNKILNILKEFKDVRLMLSMEGTEKCNEYMRFPSSWAEIKNNISQFKNLDNTYIYINTIVQNLNILYVDKLIDYAYKNNFYIKLEKITRPDYLNMLNLPKKILQKAHKRLSNIKEEKLIHAENVKEIILILENHLKNYVSDELKYQEFVSMIQKRDNYRKVNIKDYLPELANNLNL